MSPQTLRNKKKSAEVVNVSEAFYGTGASWAVLVGVNEYEDAIHYGKLQVCEQDVAVVRERLITGGFDSRRVHLLTDHTDRAPTRANILESFQSVANATETNDLLLFYYSGHGDEEAGESYLIARDGRRLILRDTAVSLSRIKEIMEKAPAKGKIIVLDACHSGADIKGKGPEPMSATFIQRVFAEARGMAILASCTQGEFSYEWRDNKRSVFTHYFLEALEGRSDRDNKGFVTVQDTSRYVTNGVKLWATQHNVNQTPTFQYSATGDIILVHYGHSRPRHNFLSTQSPNLLHNSRLLTISNREEQLRVAAVEKVKECVRSSRYSEAVRYADEEWTRVTAYPGLPSPQLQAPLAELGVWQAHALIYTGDTDRAIELLHEVIKNSESDDKRKVRELSPQRWHLVLGRAYNHLGYTHWMVLGHYELALQEFRKAIKHFVNGGDELKEELATTFDNMGRVYAQLGYQMRSELLIEHGLRIRQEIANQESKDFYRYALSLNSSAIGCVASGETYRALALSEEALKHFQSCEPQHGKRGEGLALITKGSAERFISTFINNRDQAKEFLNCAETDLKAALDVFRQERDEDNNVKEPIRLVQALNELGCVYREFLTLQVYDRDHLLRNEVPLAINCFQEGLAIAEQHEYWLQYVDTCEDLAQTYYLSGNPSRAKEQIELADNVIPSSYRFQQKDNNQKILPEHYTEEYWQLLGKLYIMRGQMRGRGWHEIQKAVEDYTLAVSYFGKFLSRPLNRENISLYPSVQPQLANHRLFVQRLYDSFRSLTEFQLNSARSIANQLVGKYNIDPTWIETFYEDTLDFLLDMQGADG